MMTRRIAARMTAANVLLSVMLAGCASSSPLADHAADLDGQKQESKPGMARLYLMNGYLRFTKSANGEQPAPTMGRAPGGLAGAIITGLAVGATKAIVDNAKDSQKEETKELPTGPADDPNTVVAIFRINEIEIGKVGQKQYLAVDLPPGTYEVSNIHGGVADMVLHQVPIFVTLTAGEVSYYRALGDFDKKERTLEACPVDCAKLIATSSRIATDSAVTSALKPQPAQTSNIN